MRPSAKELMEHAWIKSYVHDPEIGKEIQLDIIQNLQEFRAASVFQSGVLSFVVALKSTSDDLDELKKMFIKLDTSKDGLLSIDEIKNGLDSTLGNLKGN